MPRPTNTAQRRQQIVRGLERIMAAAGYEGATVAAVAEAAGLAPGLIHYHFRSKQEILVALVRDLADRLARRWQATPGDSPRSRLEAWLDAHVALGAGADPQAVACWVAIGAEALRQPEVQAVYAEALLEERRMLEALLAQAGCRGDLEEKAAGLLAAVQGAFLVGTAAPQAAPRGFARTALRAMVEGLLP